MFENRIVWFCFIFNNAEDSPSRNLSSCITYFLKYTHTHTNPVHNNFSKYMHDQNSSEIYDLKMRKGSRFLNKLHQRRGEVSRGD